MLKAYLCVSSDAYDPGDLTRMLGSQADAIRRQGEQIAPSRPISRNNEWRRFITGDSSVEQFEEIARRVEAWGIDFARRLGTLVRGGQASVELRVIQELNEFEGGSKGIHLDAALIEWLAAASASVDIDQYFSETE